MMQRVKNGLVASFVATAVVSVVEAINMYGLKLFQPFPEVIARMAGAPGNSALGWAIQIVGGVVVLGAAFALLYDRIPTKTPITRGIVFAIGGWVLMMLYITMVIPSRQAIPSGGFESLAWMMALNIVYGAILGNMYDRLLKRDKAHALGAGTAPAH